MAERGVVAEHSHVEQADNLRIVGKLPPGGGMDHAAAVKSNFAGCDPQATHRHPVFGQRASLVGENDRRRAQRFDSRQALDQRILPRHAPHAARERQGGDDRQTFWNRSHGQCDRRLDDEECVLACGYADRGNQRGQD